MISNFKGLLFCALFAVMVTFTISPLTGCTGSKEKKNEETQNSAPAPGNSGSAPPPESLDKVLSQAQVIAFQNWKDQIVKSCDAEEILTKKTDTNIGTIGFDFKALLRKNHGSKLIELETNHFAVLASGKNFFKDSISRIVKTDPKTGELNSLRFDRSKENCTVSLNDEILYSTEVYQNLVVWGDFNLNKRIAPVEESLLSLNRARSISEKTGLVKLNAYSLKTVVDDFLKPNDVLYRRLATYLGLPFEQTRFSILPFKKEYVEENRFENRNYFIKTLGPWPSVDFATDGLFSSDDFFIPLKPFSDLSNQKSYPVKFRMQFQPKDDLNIVRAFDFETQMNPAQNWDQNSTLNLNSVTYQGNLQPTVSDFVMCLNLRFENQFHSNDSWAEVVQPSPENLSHSCEIYQGPWDSRITDQAFGPLFFKVLTGTDLSLIQSFNQWDAYFLAAYNQARSLGKTLAEYFQAVGSTANWVKKSDDLTAVLDRFQSAPGQLPADVRELPVFATLSGYEIKPETLQQILTAYSKYGSSQTMKYFFEAVFKDFRRGKIISAKDLQFINSIDTEYLEIFQIVSENGAKLSYPLLNAADVFLRDKLWSKDQLKDLNRILMTLVDLYKTDVVISKASVKVNEMTLNLYETFGLSFVQRTLKSLHLLSFVFEGSLENFIVATGTGRAYDPKLTEYLENLFLDNQRGFNELKSLYTNNESLELPWFSSFFIPNILPTMPSMTELQKYTLLSLSLLDFKRRDKKKSTSLISTFESDFSVISRKFYEILAVDQEVSDFESMSELIFFSPKCSSPGLFESASSKYKCLQTVFYREQGGLFNPQIRPLITGLTQNLIRIFKENNNPFQSNWRQKFLDFYFSKNWLACSKDFMEKQGLKIQSSLQAFSQRPNSDQRTIEMEQFLDSLQTCGN